MGKRERGKKASKLQPPQAVQLDKRTDQPDKDNGQPADVFPDWANNLLRAPSGETTHGLNLVLELDPTPNRLPLLLWDIVLAQDKIKRALEELSFVHFARFIPSYDGRALMVTTEFDGPLDPYVLDFVIALGDVFDVLLSYVKEPPALPVRNHPDEFLRWVRKWNRVPFHPSIGGLEFKFRESFDYPLYSAYRGKTVTDIAGARQMPLAPALDHPGAVVDEDDVQGNILRGYGAWHGRYLFFRVVDAAKARHWLARELPKPGQPWGGIATAALWPTRVAPEVLTQVAFTHAGLQALLGPGAGGALEAFPADFRGGAAQRADDNFDRGESHPDHWIFGAATDPVHVVLFVYTKTDPAPRAFFDAVAALEGVEAASGLKPLRTLAGARLPNRDDPKDPYGKEPFGFADGISDPQISGQCPGPEPAYQPAASPGEFLLHPDYTNIYGGPSLGDMPPALATNGSFGVLRLMEQYVAKFKTSTAAEATRLGVDADLLRAKLMGRWENGTPLALSPVGPAPAPASNAFDYAPSWEFPDVPHDHDGLRCPVGAHIRRAYPRTARVAGQRHARRLLRRGMPARWKEADGIERQGLMGLFLGASIEQGFEFIQREWLQGSLAASGIRGTSDPIAAIRDGDTEFPFLVPHPVCDKAPPLRLVAKIPPLVRTRGCLYLLFPGIQVLKGLETFAPSPASAQVQEVTQNEMQSVTLTAASAAQAALQAAQSAASKAANKAANGAKGAVGAVSASLNDVGGTTRAVLGSLTQHLQDAAGDIAESAKVAAAQAIPALQAGLHGVAHLDGTKALRQLELLLDAPALDGLDNLSWRDVVRQLKAPKVGSALFKRIIDTFVPPPPETPVKPPDGVPEAGLDLADPRLCADPFAALLALRQQGRRIVWVAAQEACWVLGHADCKDLLNRHDAFVQAPADTRLRGIVTLDRPRHAAVSAAYKDAFSAALAAITSTDRKQDAIGQAVDAQLATLSDPARQRHFDVMRDYAHPVARSVVWRLIGIGDKAEQAHCDALADTLVLHHGKTAAAGVARGMVAADAGLRLAARLTEPLGRAWAASIDGDLGKYAGTLLGELAARTKPGLPGQNRVLYPVEALLTLVQTVLASQSPHFLLGSAALHLMTPDPRLATPATPDATPWQALHALKSNPTAFGAALDKALEEARRTEPPLTLIERYAKGAQQIAGVTVPDGCAVFAMVASANRDAAVFGADAEQFHFDRTLPNGSLLSLGHGIHECAGQALQARLAPVALGSLIAAMGDLRLRNPTAFPAWHPTVYFRVLQALSVTRCRAGGLP